MSKEKHDSSKHCKSHHVQRAELKETKVLAEQGASIPQRHPLIQQISRMANIPNPGAHAAILNRTAANQLSSNRQLLLQLQRQYGNSYVQQVMQQMQHMRELVPSASTQQPLVQAKLTIGEPGSEYEREADKVARQVVQLLNAPASVESAQSQTVQRQAKEEDELQMKPVVQLQANTEMVAAPDLEASINQARGRGQPLADNIREPIEQAFGADFSGVKVHTDARADQLNQSIQAKAFTTGQDVFFRQGEYNPGSRGGQELIAHELTHVVQQSGGVVQRVKDFKRAAGNSAVGSLIQRVSSKGKKALKKMQNISLKEVEDWQKSGELTDADVDKVLMLGATTLEDVLLMSATYFKGAATSSEEIDEIYQVAKTKSANKAMSEAQSSASRAPSKNPILVALNNRGIDDNDANPFIKRVRAAEIQAWLDKTTNDTIVYHTIIASNKESKTLDEMETLVVTNNTHNYDEGELLDFVRSYGYDSVLNALQTTVVDNNLEFLKLWLSYGVTISSPVVLKKLVRFQARLRTTNAVLTVYKADTEYKGSQDPPSRTGFLEFDFGNEKMEIHTHWNESKKKIVSMHVQDNNKNGIEMNTWNWFADVAKAVLTAHNTSSVYPPTTQPPNSKLIL